MSVPVRGRGPQVDKFEQVSSDGHQMLLVRGWGRGSHMSMRCRARDGSGPLSNDRGGAGVER